PTTPNAYNSTLTGPIDMFILSLSGTNGSLLHSTYVGGSGTESAFSMDFDSEGNVWATGITDSGDFPMTPSSLYPKHNGSLDAVLFQLSNDTTTLMYSTFLGGTGGDYGYGVLVDSSDDVWVTGTTDSSNFPTTSDAYKNTTSGGGDIYLLRLAGDGSSLVYSTYFGGSGNDYVIDLAFDSSGNIWGTGATFSMLFPTTSNAYDSSHGGSTDCVIFQFANNGSLLYSTYVGGSGQDWGRFISIDGNDAVWVSGDTMTDTFPTTPDAFNESYSGSRDAFLLSLAPNGTDLYYSTFLGGSDTEFFPSLAVGPGGRVWIAGETESTNFPTTEDAFNRSISGTQDMFVTSFTVYSAPSPPINLSAIESVDETVVLLWEEPEFDGNLDVSSYRVYRNTTSGYFDTVLEETTYEYFVDTTALPDTTYHYVVSAVNAYGESFASNEITVNTPDLTPPTINHPQDITYTEGDLGHFISWTPADTNPASFYITRNGVMVISGDWLGSDITLNVDLLPEGLYAFNCTVVDQGGNSVGDVVNVVVEAGPQPTTTTTTTTGGTTGTGNGETAVTLILLVGIAVVVVLLLAIFGLMRGLRR
ncbi:MAG: SBBP repeat-containing protein, partial [Promethearchaeota archaeon]